MTFALYVIGFMIFVGGVAWALITAGVRQLYVIIACMIMLGLGIMIGAVRTRSKDRSD